MKTVLLALSLLAASLAQAAELPAEYYDQDVQRLIKTDFFAFGGIGFAGSTSEGEVAFGRIVRKKEAIRYILAAFEHGSDCSRCYALVALRESSPEFYRSALAWLRKHPPKKIKTMSGCIIRDDESDAVINAIDAGEYAEYFKKYEAKKS